MFSISTVSMSKNSFISSYSVCQTVPFQTIQFSISMQFSSIQFLDRALSDVTIPGQSGPGSDGNEGVLCIPQSPSITGTSPSDCLVSYPEHSFGGGLTPLQRCSWCILQPQPTGQYTELNVKTMSDNSV